MRHALLAPMVTVNLTIRETAMLRFALVLSLAATLAPAAMADSPVTGKWFCDYGVRKLSSAVKSSSAWFELTLSEGGKFRGAGKATAAGSSLPMIVRGAWSMDGALLKLTGVSDLANRVVPFRFISKRVSDNRFKQREVKGAAEYRTSCKRDP